MHEAHQVVAVGAVYRHSRMTIGLESLHHFRNTHLGAQKAGAGERRHDLDDLGIACFQQVVDQRPLGGIELSALGACLEFSRPTAVIVKHTNPCGVCTDDAGVATAYKLARETDPVLPVPVVDVEATLVHLPEVVADMVRVQMLTGMRSGELVIMRPCDIDRTDKVWRYTPQRHKTQHYGKTRVVAIGPQAQGVLLKYLARDEQMFLFRPVDSESKRRAAVESLGSLVAIKSLAATYCSHWTKCAIAATARGVV